MQQSEHWYLPFLSTGWHVSAPQWLICQQKLAGKLALNHSDKWQILLGWEIIKTVMIGLAQEGGENRNNT